MGFRTGAFAKVWTVESISETSTKLRISISRKNRRTQEYEQDFSGFVNCIGTAAASKACSLKEGSRIKLGDVDVTTNYNKEKGTSYTNFKIFSFEIEDEAQAKSDDPKPKKEVDDGEHGDSRLPF